MRGCQSTAAVCAALACILIAPRFSQAARPRAAAAEEPEKVAAAELESLRLAIEDLIDTFGPGYPEGRRYLARLDQLASTPGGPIRGEFVRLRREALLANPLVDFDRLILLERGRGQAGLPTNHQCNSCLDQSGYDNRIAVLSLRKEGATPETLFAPNDRLYVGEMDLDFDGRRLLFTMPNGRSWQIHEIETDGTGMRQVSRQIPDVDNFDPCWLPDGRIVFASTACFVGVPCWHGRERACNLYLMNADGSGVRQLCFDQDHDLHPAVLANGQVIYSRWDYTGIMHMYLRPLMVMNPDGSAQRAVYGSNSYYPNALYYPQPVPGEPNKLAVILSGYHGVNRAGELVVLDTTKGWHQADGILRRIAHRGEPPEPIVRDNLVGPSWPKFLHPRPLSEKYFLVAAQIGPKAPWGIYLADAFDNLVPLAVDARHDYFEPIPLKSRPRPPAIPDRIDPQRDDAVVYLHDVYAGPGLAGVPRGSVKRLRIVAYEFGYPGMAGPDKIGRGGPWDAMRIVGTVPVYEDGSTSFRVPASTPISVQPLDAEGKALQLMRSWYTAMPGETASCVGCHEQPKQSPIVRHDVAATRAPVNIDPWYGPARGFDFEREVQPVLDKYCVECHDGSSPPVRSTGFSRPQSSPGRLKAGLRTEMPTTNLDLRGERFAVGYQGLPLSQLGASRLDPGLREMADRFAPFQPPNKLIGDRKTLYTPAYEALVPFIRRVNVEDYVGLHVPAEYHADTSELVQMLQKGHYGVELDREAWDRLVTWIDLNGPCHGTWGDVAPIPQAAGRRRHELAQLFGGPKVDPEAVPARSDPIHRVSALVDASRPPEGGHYERTVWSDPIHRVSDLVGGKEPRTRDDYKQPAPPAAVETRSVDLGGGVVLRLVRIPAGRFVMGSADGPQDESPPGQVVIRRDFWMAACEITNAQFRRFDPDHFSGYFTKRSLDVNGPGVDMDAADLPAVRVSWQQAAAFCRWLSAKTDLSFSLPSEAQWEYACRAGTTSDLSYGDLDSDFSDWANLADGSLAQLHTVTGGVVAMVDIPCDERCDDHAVATTAVASYRPNAWGLYDMHGNAAEWTRTSWRPYPYRDDDGRNELAPDDRKVVRGGSFYDRPKRARSAYRLSYPAWQQVHNVGFRVVAQ